MYAPKTVDPRVADGRKRLKQLGEAAENKADSLAEMNLTRKIEAEDDASVSSVKCVDANDIVKRDNETDDAKTFPYSSGGPNSVSAKSILHETCALKNWKAPQFECCADEGPSHRKLYIFKVIVEIAEVPSTILECLSAPWPKKKTAAEHAAEGALWYLKNLGYFPIKK